MDNNNKPSNSPADSSSLSTSSNYLRQVNKLSHKISKPTINREINLPLPPPPPLHQHQPPVYNINKSDFRDVVQKLTGSPSQNRISSSSSPPSIQKTQSSRLHRIRPPPLAHVINRPPSLLNHHQQNWTGGFNNPLSPLPPLPPVHAAAESPVSSYMRYLQNSMFGKELSPLAPLVSPRWYQQQQQQQQENVLPPKSPYGLLSPSVLLSPVSPKTKVID